MFSILEQAVSILLSHGALGVVVLAQMYWIRMLHNQLSAVQEKRVQDAYKLAESVSTCAIALERNTDVLNALKDS